MLEKLKEEAIRNLQALIKIPSFSREEQQTAAYLVDYLRSKGLSPTRQGNNVWIRSRKWDSTKPVILLCSHHDTVRPVGGWTKDPFGATLENECLYGLGSNDAGAALLALLTTFLWFETHPGDLSANLIFAAVAEEEISGANGISSILETIGPIELGVIGEPTQMHMAVAEKGLMVIDGTARGKAGHAAREEGINAIYKALTDIERLRKHRFGETSPLLGKVKVSVTQIEAGVQHNVVPDTCNFVIDVRTNEYYSNREVLEQLQSVVESQLVARALRLNSSRIELDHPIVR